MVSRRALLLLCSCLAAFARGEEASETEKDEGKGENTRKSLAEGYTYCEYDNCYELLGVKRTSALPAIKRSYRKLAAEWHPDKCPSGNVPKCRELFPKYAAAYEVLSNSEMRKNYDYVLDNPYEFPGFYLKYSRPQYAAKSDLRVVFIIILVGAACVQYFLKRQMYEQALVSVKKNPRFRYTERLKEIMSKSTVSPKKASGAQRGDASSTKGKSKGEELEKRKKEAEAVLEAELAAELPPPPLLADNVAVSVFKLPLTVVYTALWVVSGGMREPGYRTRRALGMSAAEWGDLAEEEQAEYVGMELWIGENFAAYESELADAARSGVMERSGKEKRAARARKREARNPTTMHIDD